MENVVRRSIDRGDLVNVRQVGGDVETGRHNVTVGLVSLIGFAAMGFVLVYLRDFAPGKEEWTAAYAVGKHFESRLAHVHGNLFALLNIAIGLTLPRMASAGSLRSWAAAAAMLGMLMPIGILGEVLLGTSPIFVLVGGASMLTGLILATVAWLRTGE